MYFLGASLGLFQGVSLGLILINPMVIHFLGRVSSQLDPATSGPVG